MGELSEMAAGPSGPSPLVLRLLRALDDSGVRYVHWKSNRNIERALAGDEDLDILVHPEDREACEKTFRTLRLVHAKSRKDAWQQGLVHFVGADTEQCRLIHVHAHYALPVGFDYNKNFVLPVVEACLAARVRHGPVFILHPALEYILLVIRLVLKHGLDTFLLKPPHRILRLLLRKSGAPVVQGGGYAEFEDLLARVDRTSVEEVVATHFAFVGADVFEFCEQTVRRNASWREYFAASRILKRRLRKVATDGAFVAFLRAAWRLNKDRLLRALRMSHGKAPATGGKLIAFVGGDGAGKSTNVELLARTLGRELWVRTIHVGRPAPSWRGYLARLASGVASVVGAQALGCALVQLRVALDRVAAFERAGKLRRQGAIVILDRFPLPGVATMDCPRIHALGKPWLDPFAALEKRLYGRIVGVDCLIVLKLDPEIALQRRPEDNPAELRARSGEIWNDAWHAPWARVIDTGQLGIDEVRVSVLTLAWETIAKRHWMVELLGLSGVGKSTAVARVRELLPNVRTTIPYRDYKWQLLLGILLGAGMWLRILFRTRNFNVAGNGPLFIASLLILEAIERGRGEGANYLFDQGPVFQHALALKEGALAGWQDALARRVTGGLDCVLSLEAPDEVLRQRIRRRGVAVGRAVGIVEEGEKFSAFCAAYRSAFDEACAHIANVIRIEASSSTEDVVAHVHRELKRL